MKSDVRESAARPALRTALSPARAGRGIRTALALLFLPAALLLLAPAAFAHPRGGHPALRWRALRPPARRILRPFAPRWRHLPAARRRALLRAAHRWLRLPPARRKELLKRLRNWRRLPPALRRRLWKRYRAFQRLPRAERQRILRAYRLFRRLPAWKRRALLRRWRHHQGGPGGPGNVARFLPVVRYRADFPFAP